MNIITQTANIGERYTLHPNLRIVFCANRKVANGWMRPLYRLYLLCLPGDCLTSPDQHLFNHCRGMDSCPPNHIMKRYERPVPGADRDAPATACPFLLVGCPEGYAPLSIIVPFSESRVVVYTEWLIRRWPERDSISRAVDGAVFTGHTEIVDTEGNRLIHLKW